MEQQPPSAKGYWLVPLIGAVTSFAVLWAGYHYRGQFSLILMKVHVPGIFVLLLAIVAGVVPTLKFYEHRWVKITYGFALGTLCFLEITAILNDRAEQVRIHDQDMGNIMKEFHGTQEMIGHANNQVQITESTKSGKTNYGVVNRAELHIDSPLQWFTGTREGFPFNVHVTNRGKLPSYGMNYSYLITIQKGILSPTDEHELFLRLIKNAGSVVGPKTAQIQSGDTNFFTLFAKPTREDVDGLKDGTRKMYVMILINYGDKNQRVRHTAFCAHYGADQTTEFLCNQDNYEG